MQQEVLPRVSAEVGYSHRWFPGQYRPPGFALFMQALSAFELGDHAEATARALDARAAANTSGQPAHHGGPLMILANIAVPNGNHERAQAREALSHCEAIRNAPRTASSASPSKTRESWSPALPSRESFATRLPGRLKPDTTFVSSRLRRWRWAAAEAQTAASVHAADTAAHALFSKRPLSEDEHFESQTRTQVSRESVLERAFQTRNRTFEWHTA